MQGLEALSNQGLLHLTGVVDCLVDHKFTEPVDDAELVHHACLHLLGLALQKSVLAEVEYFLTQQTQDVEDILTLALALVGFLAEVRDECLAAVVPILFDNTDQRCVEFGQEMGLLAHHRLIFRHLVHQLDRADLDGIPVLLFKNLPSSLHDRKTITMFDQELLTFTASSKIYKAKNLACIDLLLRRMVSTHWYASE